jgi:hypothetical protein
MGLETEFKSLLSIYFRNKGKGTMRGLKASKCSSFNILSAVSYVTYALFKFLSRARSAAATHLLASTFAIIFFLVF